MVYAGQCICRCFVSTLLKLLHGIIKTLCRSLQRNRSVFDLLDIYQSQAIAICSEERKHGWITNQLLGRIRRRLDGKQRTREG